MNFISSSFISIFACTFIGLSSWGFESTEAATANEIEASEYSDVLAGDYLLGDFDVSGGNFTLDRGRGGHDRGRDRYNPPRRGGGHYPPPRDGRRDRDHDRGRGGDYYPPGRGGHDRGGGGRGGDYYPPPGRGSYGDCGSQSVTLLCKVNRSQQYVTAYTNCGYGREGSICYSVQTPGYYQEDMRVAFRCERGVWTWVLGQNGMCKLRY